MVGCVVPGQPCRKIKGTASFFCENSAMKWISISSSTLSLSTTYRIGILNCGKELICSSQRRLRITTQSNKNYIHTVSTLSRCKTNQSNPSHLALASANHSLELRTCGPRFPCRFSYVSGASCDRRRSCCKSATWCPERRSGRGTGWFFLQWWGVGGRM